MTKRPSRILTLAAAFCLFAGAAPLRGQDIEPVVTTLPNGVRVAIVENHQAPVVSCRLAAITARTPAPNPS